MSEKVPALKKTNPRTVRQRRDIRYITNGFLEVILTTINTKVKIKIHTYPLTHIHTPAISTYSKHSQTFVTIFDIVLVSSSLPDHLLSRRRCLTATTSGLTLFCRLPNNSYTTIPIQVQSEKRVKLREVKARALSFGARRRAFSFLKESSTIHFRG